MLGADLVIAARGARFSLPEVNVGLFGTGGLAALLPRAVGLQKAKGLMMLGQEISATDAERWGLVWQLVDDEALHDQALHTARALARKSPQLLGEIKHLLRCEHLGGFGESLRREAEVHRRLAP
jgi:2-(1,2-epoxy-1,2-dihydrophenyl)acetyl-CoA isomerase